MTSVGDLLDATTHRLWLSADAADAEASFHEARRFIAAIDGVRIGPDQALGDERAFIGRELGRACEAAAASTRNKSGSRASALLGAAADAVSVMLPPLGPDERWAALVALTEPIRAAVAVCRIEAPSPELLVVERRLSEARLLAARHSPSVQAVARLDERLPRLVATEDGMPRLQQAVDQLAYATRFGDLTVHDARHVSAACMALALYTEAAWRSLALVGTPIIGRRDIPAVMTHSWLTARDAIRLTADGRRAPRTRTPAVTAALSSMDALAAQFGPLRQPDFDRQPAADLATLTRSIANQLPQIANNLAVSSARWAQPQVDPAATPPRFRQLDRSGVTRFLGVTAARISPTSCVIAAAAALEAADVSVLAAAEAERSSSLVGMQPQPRLVAAHLVAAAAIKVPPTVRWLPLASPVLGPVGDHVAWPALARTIQCAVDTGWEPSRLSSLSSARTAVSDPLELRRLVIQDWPQALTLGSSKANQTPNLGHGRTRNRDETVERSAQVGREQ